VDCREKQHKACHPVAASSHAGDARNASVEARKLLNLHVFKRIAAMLRQPIERSERALAGTVSARQYGL
jgi:hypothetical protein